MLIKTLNPKLRGHLDLNRQLSAFKQFRVVEGLRCFLFGPEPGLGVWLLCVSEDGLQ